MEVGGVGEGGTGGAGLSGAVAGQEGRGMLPRMNGDGVDPVFLYSCEPSCVNITLKNAKQI